MNWSTKFVIGTILVMAGIRAVSLTRYHSWVNSVIPNRVDLRTLLELPPADSLRAVVIGELRPPDQAAAASADTPGALSAPWFAVWQAAERGTTVILPDRNGRWWGARVAPGAAWDSPTRWASRLAGEVPSDVRSLADVDSQVHWIPLEGIDPASRLVPLVWDDEAPVFITAGPDGAPGVAGVDDDGDGQIDNLRELGTTGSDDRIVAPGTSDYPGNLGYREGDPNVVAERVDGELRIVGILSRVISRGALVELTDGWSWRRSGDGAEGSADEVHGLPAVIPQPPREVWLRFLSPAGEILAEFELLNTHRFRGHD